MEEEEKNSEKGFIQNPHDKFFKELFSQKEETCEFIRQTFPKNLLKKLDLESLQLDQNNYVDKELQEHFSDLVYQCTYQKKNPIKVAFLFEHKSSPQNFPPIQFQLMRYMLRIWEQNIKQKDALTPVIPIIVYHGQKKWQKKKLSDYLLKEAHSAKDLISFIPSFDYLLSDLSSYSDKEIQSLFHLVSLQSGLLLMKKIFEENLEEEFQVIFARVNELLKTEKGRSFFHTLLLYLYYTSDIDLDKIIEKMKTISLEAGQETLTLAQRLLLKGKEEGKIEGKIEIVRNMLLRKYPEKEIIVILGVDEAFIQKVKVTMKKQKS